MSCFLATRSSVGGFVYNGEGGDAGVGIAAWCVEHLGPVPLAGFIEVPEVVRVLGEVHGQGLPRCRYYHDLTAWTVVRILCMGCASGIQWCVAMQEMYFPGSSRIALESVLSRRLSGLKIKTKGF